MVDEIMELLKFKKIALFLDFDGTLVEIAPSPQNIVISSNLKPLLQRLNSQFQGAMSIISGRELITLDQLFVGEEFDVAGCHGAEIRLGKQTLNLSRHQFPSLIRDQIELLVNPYEGTFVEHKKFSVAIHLRRSVLTMEQAAELIAPSLLSLKENFKCIRGKAVLEILSADVSKDRAISYFMKTAPYCGRIPVFIGDDETDEFGFREVNQSGGVSILVGIKKTAARFQISGVHNVHELLGKLAG